MEQTDKLILRPYGERDQMHMNICHCEATGNAKGEGITVTIPRKISHDQETNAMKQCVMQKEILLNYRKKISCY